MFNVVKCLELFVTAFFSRKCSGQRGLVASLSVWLCLSLTVWVSLCCFQGRLIVYSTSVERWRKKQLCFVRRVRLHSNHGLLLRLHGKSATRPLYWPPTHPSPPRQVNLGPEGDGVSLLSSPYFRFLNDDKHENLRGLKFRLTALLGWYKFFCLKYLDF